MNLVKCNPHRRVSNQVRGHRVFDDIFDDFFAPFALSSRPANPGEGLILKVDIYEKDDTVVIDAELPGVDKEDISVDVKGKLITLGGERKTDEEVKHENYYRKERRYGKFERTFSLPFEVSGDKVKANFNNGILRLEISKPEEQVAKKITIN